jgi:murein L,D-transpeptidase YafK
MSQSLVTSVLRAVAVAAVVAIALAPPPAHADTVRPLAPSHAGSPPSPLVRRAQRRTATLSRSAGAPAVERPVAAPARRRTTEYARRPFRADSIVVEKQLRRLTLWSGGFPVRTYDVALGLNPVGAKRRARDFRTPEGLYHIAARNPHSRFHRALRVSYPNAEDVARARAMRVPTGGDVMVHGLPNGQTEVGMYHRAYDWTNGCVAVTDEEIDEMWDAVAVGTPIRILP